MRHPDPEKQKIIEHTVRAGQGHVFRWWHQIGESGRQRLLTQLSVIDFDELRELYLRWKKGLSPHLFEGQLAPADVIPLPRTAEEHAAAQAAYRTGEEAIRRGEVAIFLVAGGQATRLGIDAPKGTFRITPVKNKSIFEHHAEKIRALSRKYNVSLPYYIMTSETNHEPTREFFARNRYFGLQREDVFFFMQDMMPALDFKGRLVLDEKDHIFTSPNGHGGSITSLKHSGALDDMKARGIRHIFYFQVDNVLIKMADPLFIGRHIEKGADMSAKVAPKIAPEEKVGVVCKMGQRTTVIEYSDLSKEHMYARNPDGSLAFSAGNLAIHVLDVGFVERLNREKDSLPFHTAEKAVPYLTADGILVKPDKKTGLKFEKFVFDALASARATAILEVDRDEEFAPIKNATGADSPDTARELMIKLYAKWLGRAGVNVPRDQEGRPKGAIEISPLFALDAEELKRNLPPSFEVTFPLYLGPE
ncbi:MAG: UDPGP type 1 family protein [Candidatus Abyssubacteria bacterium]